MRLKTWILLLPLLFLSSCFEFIEEISFETEQAGTFELTLNCSQSRVRLKNILKLDTFMGYNLPEQYEISNKLYEISNALKLAKGISNIDHNSDNDQFIYNIKFHFDSIKNLNIALNLIAAMESKIQRLPYMNLYEYSDGSFKRLQVPPDSLRQNSRQDHIKLFEGATVTTIYRFKKTVENVSNPNAVISKSKTAVMLKQKVTELATKPSLLNNTIRLK